jgi:BMFP domain-containing protein YqiC
LDFNNMKRRTRSGKSIAHQDLACFSAAALSWCGLPERFSAYWARTLIDLPAAMLDPKLLDELSARLAEIAASGPARDLEKNARALLNGFFARLDFVPREEFEVQREVLTRTRAKLEALEARLAELEARR